ncbi:MAG: hypothetical protein K0M58_05700 [Thiobacillus sp.]|nr:hypothetical protein [Thiobacillus sp.]MDO9385109.1 hypothetical protein [Thiobacillus sp.]
MHENLIPYLLLLAALLTFIRAMMLSKYRNDIKSDVSGSAIVALFEFKKKRPVAGIVLMAASVLQVLCLIALAVIFLFYLP